MADQAVLVEKFDRLHDALNGELIERAAVVHGVLCALVSRQHVLMLGTKGIAKSMLARRLLAYITGARLYVTQLNRFMTLDDIFGPLDMVALENSHYRRLLVSYLADAEIAMVDEIFECNPSALVSMNTALNERRLRNDTCEVEIPLSTMICASNHGPEDDSTEAMYDRLLVRFVVDPILERGNFIRMLRLELTEDPEPILTWDEISEAQRQVAAIEIPLVIDEKLADLRWKLMEKGMQPSDRRFALCRRLLQAEAWLEASEEVDAEHLGILVHALWDQPEQVADVESAVLAVSNPRLQELMNLMKSIDQLAQKVNDVVAMEDKEEGQTHGLELYPKLTRATDELVGLKDATGRSRRTRDIVAACESRITDAMTSLGIQVFGLPPEELEGMALR